MVLNLILASTSRYRAELLARLRLPFRSEAPGVDEAATKQALRDPLAIVTSLAAQKAEAVAARFPDAIVIGSDQAASIDGDILDKPGDAPNATAQLRRLQGRPHTLLTAVAIRHPRGHCAFVDTTTLWMRPLANEVIARYVAADRPFDCAGSYRIEGLGISLFERIDCADQTAIVGLPLLRLCHELTALGLPLP
jgi:septum formation protein